jgi:hypothetical protein
MTHTTRVTPTGTPFDEGYQSLIAFAADPNLSFWETVVGAPGIDGGDPVPTTTMHNTAVRTLAPRQLKSHTPFQVQGKFSGGTIDEVYALINVNGWITVHWPDETNYSFPGYLKSFQPGQAQEGNPLEGVIEIVPTMQISGTETEYDLQVAGTGT